jgi:hypothetical protein
MDYVLRTLLPVFRTVPGVVLDGMRDVVAATSQVEAPLRIPRVEELYPAFLCEIGYIEDMANFKDLVRKRVLAIFENGAAKMGCRTLRKMNVTPPSFLPSALGQADITTTGFNVSMAVDRPARFHEGTLQLDGS